MRPFIVRVGMLCNLSGFGFVSVLRKAVFDVFLCACAYNGWLFRGLDSRRCAAGKGPATRTGRVVVV